MAASTDGPPPGELGWVSVFIRRPVLSTVLSLLVIVAGLAALMAVEVRELPSVDRPVVTVRTTYTGATPEAIDTQVTAIIESAASQVPGVANISSTSSYGSSRVVLEFTDSVDLDVAASDVRNAVAAVERRLPDAAEDPVVVKADDDGEAIMRIAVSSETLSEGELSNLIDDIIADRLASVEGVAAVNSYGLRNRIVDVKLLPVNLAARGLTVEDVENALSRVTVTAPSGALRSESQELLVRAQAPVTTPEQVGALYLNEQTQIRDIALVDWALERPSGYTRLNGRSSAGLEIIRQAQSNTIAISEGVRQAVVQLRPSLPEGVSIVVTSDDAVFIKGALQEVVSSLILATLIVIAVIFLFLRSPRLTLIPAVTIPVSLLGTIAAIWLFGFSVNILTLLALVMATGMVVDDAIVVLENIERWRSKGVGRRAAALIGTREIVFAVLSTTATLAAVFIPISFLPGQAGKLFAEFGFVLAFSVTISSMVALTLCPMLAARLAPDHATAPRRGIVARSYDRVGGALAAVYARTLGWCLAAPLITVALALLFATATLGVFRSLPQELTPPEDRGVILMMLLTQQGSNLDYLSGKMAVVESGLQELVDKGEVTNVLSLVGRRSTNSGFIVATLADWSERERSQQEIQAELQSRFSKIPGLNFRAIYPNSLGIRGAGQGLRFAVAGPTYAGAADAADAISAQLAQSGTFTSARPSFDTTQPQLSVVIDREAATALGVSIDAVTKLVNVMIDDYDAADLFVDDEIIDVVLSAGARPINDPTDIANLFVRTGDGRFVNLSSLVKVEEVAIAPNLSREQKRRAVPITAALAEGVALGDAVAEMRQSAADVLPPEMSIILLGEASVLEQSSQSLSVVFGFALLIVLLVLAAQFESVVSAAVIMITVPFGIAAAVYAMWFTGGSLNYYSAIGLVLLVGIMAKNGILIVEFANQRRDEGVGVRDAITEAAVTRLRPVVMTALSTVLGGLPLVFAFGAGAEAREALGWIVIGGLGFATIFTLYLTPVAFLMLAPFSKPRATQERALVEELARARTLVSGDGRMPAE
ncbi:efflux RND transporter permease subunit [Lutibaculum baratangense]|uniref:RND multidrug efflux transporter n=1 Tax=Lutibaculum baratangense AMV1 TaxID=631454 RepID=V4TEF8_9HYPH|nr:efflux RND transporter permease subunit [Lutibaculum baratangense]ESR24588.1 RND multidrug efflux transporter [Lutibaculum baratangense AMV1]